MDTMQKIIEERHPRLSIIALYTDSCHITCLERISFAEKLTLIINLKHDLPKIVAAIEERLNLAIRNRIQLKFESDKFSIISLYSNATNRNTKAIANFDDVIRAIDLSYYDQHI